MDEDTKPGTGGRLTKRTVDSVRPASRDTFHWDAVLKGFGIKVTPAGKRVYIVQYRMHGRASPTRRCTIGTHGAPWTPEQARTEAARLLRLVKTGIDPASLRSEAKTAPTLEEFSARYVEHIKSYKRPRSVAEDERNLKLHIVPALGSKRFRDTTARDITKFHTGMSATPTAANRCVALLSHMCSTGMKWGDYPDGPNPCKYIDKYPETKRERYLTVEEMARLGEALKKSDETWQAIAAPRLLLLTGCRLAEIMTLQWQHVDFDARCLRLPTSKTGAKIVPVADAALDLLNTLPRVDDSLYVLPAARGDGHFSGIQRPWQRIREAAKIHDVRLHDLRHSFASVAVSGGESLFLTGKVLGHKQAATTQRYAHLHGDPARAVAGRAASAIVAAMKPSRTRKTTASVIALPRRKRAGATREASKRNAG